MVTAWREIATERAEADEPFDAGLTQAIQSRLTTLYEQSTFDICVPANPPEQAHNATTSTSEWTWMSSFRPHPVIARGIAGTGQRQIFVECQMKGSTASAWKLRFYLLKSRHRPELDDTDAVLDNDSYVELDRSSTSYDYESDTVLVPDVGGALSGDGTIPGLSVPVYWLHACHKGAAAITVYFRDIRIAEVIP